jgi:cytochrome c oxidase subunit 2
MAPGSLYRSLPSPRQSNRAWPLPLRLVAWALVSGVGTTAALAVSAAGSAEFEICQSCHGTRGQGTTALAAPRIAGLDASYVARQLTDFRAGRRGGTGAGSPGAQMAAIAQSLDEAAIGRVSGYVERLPEAPGEATIGGDRVAGAALYSPCGACHGVRAEGGPAMGAPRLAGMSDWYLVRQLEAFRAGQRGSDASGSLSAPMRAMAASLADGQAVRDVIAYATSLGASAPDSVAVGETRP